MAPPREKQAFVFSAIAAAAGVVIVACLTAPVAYAQMALPGAVAPTPAGAIASTGGSKKNVGAMGEARLKAVMPKAPADDTIVGKTLKHDGAGSEIQIVRNGADLQVARLVFAGDRLSRSGEQCKFEPPGAPLKLTTRDSVSGLRRYQLDLPGCAFSFDVLDGAILASHEGKACEFRQSDCRADPEGLWGMGETDFDPKTAEDMLELRARVERTVRSNYRALYDRNKGDKPVRAFVVREQAEFSSWREEICRSYAREADFGYCALRLTEARAILLGAQIASGVKLPELFVTAPVAKAAGKN